MSKLFKKYLDKITNSTLSEQNIISLRSQVNGRRPSSMTDVEKERLIETIYTQKPRVSNEQAAKGIDWLRRQWHTPTGKVCKHNPFGDYEQYVLENFGHFELVDLYDMATSFAVQMGFHSYLPVYRVYTTSGERWFDYVAGCWQSGESLRIL